MPSADYKMNSFDDLYVLKLISLLEDPKIEMVFKCQEDSFLKEFASKVVLCEKGELKRRNVENKAECLSGYNVVLHDSIFFPEGGGQPCDYGWINEKPVISVLRKGAEAHHFIESAEAPFDIGETVVSKIDWDRRHDHMQQHSGQHLISALFERDYNFNTISWSLGQEVSYIELSSNAVVTQDHIDTVERVCNELIAAATPVYAQILGTQSPEDVSEEVLRATRGLPKDHVGDVRVITIHGVESNMCCGTHVTNLAQLNCIKLLNIEKTKARQFLHFLVGNRVMRRLHDTFNRECQMNILIKGGPASHIDLLKKLQANQKSNQRNLQKCLKEIAVFEAEKLKSMAPLPKWYALNRNYGIEPDFINTFLQNAPTIAADGNGLSLLMLTVGEDNGTKGQLTLAGDDAIVMELGPKICEILDGKGNGKGQRFQAKVNNLKRLPECEKLLSEYFQ